MPNYNDVSPDVIKAIAKLTTEWEQAGRDPDARYKRHVKMTTALGDALRQQYLAAPVSNPADIGYWTTWVTAFIQRLEPTRLRQAPLAVPGGVVDDPASRRVIHCTMGQGVVADLRKYSLFSDQFSSCSPIVMFNDRTCMGGLFHYGARSKIQRTELDEMYARVQPTHILLNKRPRIQDYSGEWDDRDLQSLAKYFHGRASLMEIDSRSGSFAVFLDHNGDLEIGTQPSGAIFDATNIVGPASLNPEVSLLVNLKVYDPGFSTDAKRL